MFGHAIRGAVKPARSASLAVKILKTRWVRRRRKSVVFVSHRGLLPLLLVVVGGCTGGVPEPPEIANATSTGPVSPGDSQPSVHVTPAHLNPATAPGPPLPPPKPMAAAVVKKFFLFPADKPMISYPKPQSFSGGFFVDPSSGKLAWKAMVCTAADCPGRKPGQPPEPFAIRHAYLYPLPNGDTPNLFDDGKGPQACPHCGRSQTMTEYLPPGDESRKARLEAELQQSYADRIVARSAGKQAADMGRSPQEIMDEINSISRHFLLDKDMDYAPLEAAAQAPEPPGP